MEPERNICKAARLPFVPAPPRLRAVFGSETDLLYIRVVDKISSNNLKNRRVLLVKLNRVILAQINGTIRRHYHVNKVTQVYYKKGPRKAGGGEEVSQVLLKIPTDRDLLISFKHDDLNPESGEEYTPEYFLKVIEQAHAAQSSAADTKDFVIAASSRENLFHIGNFEKVEGAQTVDQLLKTHRQMNKGRSPSPRTTGSPTTYRPAASNSPQNAFFQGSSGSLPEADSPSASDSPRIVHKDKMDRVRQEWIEVIEGENVSLKTKLSELKQQLNETMGERDRVERQYTDAMRNLREEVAKERGLRHEAVAKVVPGAMEKLEAANQDLREKYEALQRDFAGLQKSFEEEQQRCDLLRQELENESDVREKIERDVETARLAAETARLTAADAKNELQRYRNGASPPHTSPPLEATKPPDPPQPPHAESNGSPVTDQPIPHLSRHLYEPPDPPCSPTPPSSPPVESIQRRVQYYDAKNGRVYAMPESPCRLRSDASQPRGGGGGGVLLSPHPGDAPQDNYFKPPRDEARSRAAYRSGGGGAASNPHRGSRRGVAGEGQRPGGKHPRAGAHAFAQVHDLVPIRPWAGPPPPPQQQQQQQPPYSYSGSQQQHDDSRLLSTLDTSGYHHEPPPAAFARGASRGPSPTFAGAETYEHPDGTLPRGLQPTSDFSGMSVGSSRKLGTEPVADSPQRGAGGGAAGCEEAPPAPAGPVRRGSHAQLQAGSFCLSTTRSNSFASPTYALENTLGSMSPPASPKTALDPGFDRLLGKEGVSFHERQQLASLSIRSVEHLAFATFNDLEQVLPLPAVRKVLKACRYKQGATPNSPLTQDSTPVAFDVTLSTSRSPAQQTSKVDDVAHVSVADGDRGILTENSNLHNAVAYLKTQLAYLDAMDSGRPHFAANGSSSAPSTVRQNPASPVSPASPVPLPPLSPRTRIEA
ncbi:hypothetical protein DIPPA_07554 [Diplonema papillatum]|nr:hypothetical protein DIPPA_07554 [Diplonema papillatum]